MNDIDLHTQRAERAAAISGSRKRSPVRMILLIVVAVAIAGIVGWRVMGQGGGAGAKGGRFAGPPPPVGVAVAVTHDVPVEEDTIGTVLAYRSVDIKSQIDGVLKTAHIEDGQIVKEGDLLFEIDPRPFVAALHQAEATEAKDTAQLASAKSNQKRQDALAAMGATPVQTQEDATATAGAMAATVQADQAAVETAKLNLSYTEIRAPVPGKTGAILIHPGNLVKANDTNALVLLTQVQPVKISFNLPESDLTVLHARLRDQALVATLRPRPGNEAEQAAAANLAKGDGAANGIQAPVDFISNTVDNKAGTIELRSTYSNSDFELVPGELVDVAVRLDTLRNVTVIPRAGANVGPDGRYVDIVKPDGTIEIRPVTVVYENKDITAISAGLGAGERVVVDGQLRLNKGTKVTVVSGPGASGAGANGAGANGAGANGARMNRAGGKRDGG